MAERMLKGYLKFCGFVLGTAYFIWVIERALRIMADWK